MPPANTPTGTTPASQPQVNATFDDAQHVANHPSLRSSTPMSYLSAPVPDYAGSLFTVDSDEANTAFLRQSLDAMSSAPARTSSIDHSRDPRLSPSRRHNASSRGTSPSQRDRLQRYLSNLYRMHNPPAPVAAAYSNRTPSPTNQNIYDWAPATSGDPTRADRGLVSAADEDTNVAGQSTVNSRTTTHRSQAEPERWNPDEMEQVTSREANIHPSESMLRYFIDREGSGLSEEEERARGTGWYRPSPLNTENWHTTTRADPWRVTSTRHLNMERNRQERVDALRREYLSDGVTSRTSTGSPRSRTGITNAPGPMESVVRYLDSLRHCDCYDDSLAAAIELNLTTKDLFASKHDEFLLDIDEVEPLCRTSWLQPGAVFEGHQYASNAVLPRARRPSTTSVNGVQLQQSTSGTDSAATSTRDAAPRTHVALPMTGSLLARMAAATYDHWPVRMIIHAINPDDMTLQGTMEAYDVPQHPPSLEAIRTGVQPKAGKKNAPITTYVEGQIIDFRSHSLLTPRAEPRDQRRARIEPAMFPAATPSKDAENWRRLPPFEGLPESYIAEVLSSKDQLNTLNKEYVFMRWKERCFVHGKNDLCSDSERLNDHDRGHGLTINGFYYISMKRSDATVEGLYYDPHSTPYQHLKLQGMRATWPAWQFR
ncbi:hypothetical protein AMS68_001579 [Peltaster fructicola]|uniref:Vacuolar import and degradation protein-domain-containing protein n=1 Tax=Peltaster fructicola TaxID=286661 RepID=A0A6H0XMS7_9PEZI|nr:hypothetical protein AMS68_001579 [Peltaster fructicola]